MDNTRVLLRSGLNLGFSLNYFTFLLHDFENFYQRMNKPDIHNNIGNILSLQNELKLQLVSILRAKL